jgi:hypothetical protein
MVTATTSPRALAIGMFAMLFATYAYFYQGGGWNENSRMDLVRALVEDRTLAIDRYAENTGDKARFGDHYYSDKAPGTSFLGAPVYALLTIARPLFSTEHDFLVLASWLVTALVVGGATALAGALLYRLGRDLGATDRGALAAAASYGLGTTAFPLSTMLIGHQVAAATLFGTFVLLRQDRERHSPTRSFAAGLLATAAIGVEFPTALCAPLFLAYHASGPERARRVKTFLLGCTLPVLIVGAYLTLAFGSPFQVGYGLLSNPTARSGMLAHGLFGVTYPKPGVLLELVWGRYRGLLPYSPILLLAGAGFFRRVHSRERALAASVAITYLLFVSSYEWWEGGSSFGSRHLGPMLPFLCLPLTWMMDARPKLGAALAVASIGFMTVVTSVQPKPSDQIRDPFFGAIWPAFIRGHIAANNICPVTGRASEPGHRPFLRTASHDAFNAGMFLRARGKRTLAPLFAIWLASLYGFAQATSRRSSSDEALTRPEAP